MSDSHTPLTGGKLAAVTLSALGIVYGDIGTSPLYALRECFSGPHGITPSHENVLGVLSLIFWSLFNIISLKYLAFVMRADNRGEGGIMALLALIRKSREKSDRWDLVLVTLGLFGAALLYGDGMITPAISVLSAVEGLKVATPFFEPYVIPITLSILVLLFVMQRHGTAGIGKVFGPIVMVWFLTLGVLGLRAILLQPSVLEAVNPLHAFRFFARNHWHGFLVLGSVFLCVTGGESLYVDMGHFGRRPIRLAWFVLVFPALLLNYFGQGALLIENPAAAENPFFRLVSGWMLYPLVVLAAMATVIASQAVISGAFSLTRQAVQLGFCPRMEIIHTSKQAIGQIYVPTVNWTLMVLVISLVLGFRESSNLAAAYGIAVTTTMCVTSVLSYVVARNLWGWSVWIAGPILAFFLIPDLAFFTANMTKLPQGGWFPVVVAFVLYALMSTWKKGRAILSEKLAAGVLPLNLFIPSVVKRYQIRVAGTSVFMTASEGTPPALLHNLKHNKVLHEKVVLLTVQTEEIPQVQEDERVKVVNLGEGFYRIFIRYGFIEEPNVPEVLESLSVPGLEFKMMETTFYLSRETLFATKNPGMALWREKIFVWMSRNAMSATNFFSLPPNRVVELGAHIEL